MSKLKLGRRDLLSGSLAIVLAAEPTVNKDHGVARSTLSHQDVKSVHGLPRLSPFRQAFSTWFREERTRFTLPASVGAVTSTRTELRIQGMHPAIYISIEDHPEINVHVGWEGIGWDQLLWLFASEKRCRDRVGWIDDSVLPDFRVIFPTREALWRVNMFEELLIWINEDLANATHLAMWGSADDATWARLVRDGKVLRAGWAIAENGGTPTHLLQVHGYVS